MVPCKNTAEKVSFEWSHHHIIEFGQQIQINSGSKSIDKLHVF